MPLYRITAPNGLTYEIEGPDGASDADVAQAVMAQHPEAGQPRKESGILSELRRGIEQPISSAVTGLKSVFGTPEEEAIKGVQRGQVISERAGEGPSLEAVKKAYERGLLPAAGEVLSQIPKALAGQVGTIGSAMAGARLGAMAGAPFGPVGAAIGGAGGAGAALLPQFLGSNIERQAAESMAKQQPVDIRMGEAAKAAAGQAALEGVGQAVMLGKGLVKGVLGLTDDAVLMTAKAEQELLKKAQQSLAGAATRGAAAGATEIPVEVGQQILERWQAGLPLTNSDALKEYGESAYLAGLIGGTVGGASRVMERGAARDRLAQQPPAAEPPGQLPPTAPPGTQGEMFTPEEMGRPPAPSAAPAAEPEPVAPGATQPTEQLGLGLEAVREYADLVQERERLRQQEQTPEVKARIAQLTQDLIDRNTFEIDTLRGQKAQEEEGARRFPALAAAPQREPSPQGDLFGGTEDFVLPERKEPAVSAPALKVTPGKAPVQRRVPLQPMREGVTRETPEPTITSEDIMLTAIPLGKGVQKWVQNNVWGRTRSQLQDLVTRQPDLIKGSSPRARLLRVLTAPEVPSFQEAINEPATAAQPTPEPTTERGGDQPGLELPSGPTGPGGVGGPAATPARPARPVRRRLAPAGEPVSPGGVTEGAERGALNEPSPAVVRTPGVAETLPTSAPETAAPTAVEQPAPDTAIETVDEEAARKKEAADMAERMRAAGKRPPRVAPPRVETAPRAAAEPTELPEKLREPTGINTFGVEEPEVTRGPQGMLFPMSKREEMDYAREADRRAEEARAAEEEAALEERRPKPRAQTPEGQLRLDLTNKPEPTPEPKVEPKAQPTWADAYELGNQFVVYQDDEVALVRGLNRFGQSSYFPMTRNGAISNGTIEAQTDKSRLFTPEQLARLRKVAEDLHTQEAALAAKYPDGPLTDAKTNVVGGDSVDAKYTQYLSELLKSLGLGDLKVFMYHADDVQGAENTDKHRLYGTYSAMQKFRPKETDGAVRSYDLNKNVYGMYIRGGMSTELTLETIAHEMGHIIESRLQDLADARTQQAIQDEYNAWYAKSKGLNIREFVHGLRNRFTMDSEGIKLEGKVGDQPATKMRDFEDYWASKSEWFADNVSRWATTNEKPLTITEKFFSMVAQKMRDLVAIVTGRKYPPAKSVADFLNKMGPPDLMPSESESRRIGGEPVKEQFSVSYSTEQLVDSMGDLNPPQKSALRSIIDGFKSQADPSLGVKFRTQVTDIAASIERRLHEKFNGAVRDSLGNLNPMGLYRQAQDYTKMLLEYFQQGSLVKDKTTGLWKVTTAGDVNAPSRVYDLLDAWGKKNGYSFDRATQIASRILEGVRLNEMRESNRTQGTEFLLHLTDAQIDQLVAEYRADPDLKALSDAMDAPRKALVDKMVEAGRLSPEMGKQWKDVIGYVPFDRIDDFETKFSKIKKVSGRGIAQLGKLPELVGSKERPVGNVFDNYLNTLGWMVGQTIKNDASVQTLRALEDLGQAKFLGNTPQFKDNTASAYVNGEQKYWELPSKYDVMAFKDLLPPKAGYLKLLGEASNILRTTVTALPPFALKQVVDDIQRAILTSGVKSPTAIVWRSLTNFPKLAFAELRGIRHPIVKDAEAMGFSGAFDFVQGKPAASLLADMGYKPRGWIKEALHRLEGITRASDLAVRKAIYDQTIKEGGDALLAQTRAREFINFRRRGASDLVGAMVTTIPFFNAYVQGMDVLYRAASGIDSSSSVTRAQARKLFWNRAAAVTAMSMLYALGKDDDDEQYKEADLRTRDSNWFIGGAKISVPGELGAIFKVIPERIAEYYKRQGTPEEQDAFEAMRTALSYMYEQYVGRTTPLPQAVKPLIEAWTNYSFLTGRPLEGIYQRSMLPSQRRAESTSELALAISKFAKDQVGVEVSPIMIDNTLRGYFGSTAAMTTMVTDGLLNPTRVDRPLHKWALLSNYMIDPVGTRRLGEFYEEREKVGQLNTTLNDLAKTDIKAAEAFAEKHAGELAMNTYINATLEQLEQTRAYRKYLNSPDGAAEMDKAEREREIAEIRKYEVELVSWLREAKAMMRNEAR